MLSYSERVGAVCRASTESRPRDVAAETHALLPIGGRITRLRLGWTKTTKISINNNKLPDPKYNKHCVAGAVSTHHHQ